MSDLTIATASLQQKLDEYQGNREGPSPVLPEAPPASQQQEAVLVAPPHRLTQPSSGAPAALASPYEPTPSLGASSPPREVSPFEDAIGTRIPLASPHIGRVPASFPRSPEPPPALRDLSIDEFRTMALDIRLRLPCRLHEDEDWTPLGMGVILRMPIVPVDNKGHVRGFFWPIHPEADVKTPEQRDGEIRELTRPEMEAPGWAFSETPPPPEAPGADRVREIERLLSTTTLSPGQETQLGLELETLISAYDKYDGIPGDPEDPTTEL